MKSAIGKFIPNFLLTFYRKNLKKFHGNELLDKKMLDYINFQNGFYIEMGAHDGIINSNTYYYEKKLNWKGVLIEPSKFFYDLKNNRSSKNFFYQTICVPFNFNKEISFEDIGPYSRVPELISEEYYKWHSDQAADRNDNAYYRTISVVLYLTDDFEGGRTEFPHTSYKPKAGQALIFPSNWCFPHQSTPVTKGTKIVAVTWYSCFYNYD